LQRWPQIQDKVNGDSGAKLSCSLCDPQAQKPGLHELLLLNDIGTADLLSYAAFAAMDQCNLLPLADLKWQKLLQQWSKQKQNDALALQSPEANMRWQGKQHSLLQHGQHI